MEKTNVMRLLDGAKINYTPFEYSTDVTDGETIASILSEDPDRVFKTLVTVSNTNVHFVFVVPVNRNLDLKKAAKTAGVKSIAMIKQKELLPLTGYIHGGCSPIGMKKKFRTFFNLTAADFDEIYFSAGKVGYQVKVKSEEALKYIGAALADITEEVN